MQVAVEASVDAPPETVFQVTADIANWPRFISGIRSIEALTPGAVRSGFRFRETRVMFGRQASEDMTVAEIAPPRRLVLTAVNHGTAYRAEHTFAPEGAGTRVTLTFEGHPVSLLAWALAPLGLVMLGTMKRQLQADLAGLAREAERRHLQRGG